MFAVRFQLENSSSGVELNELLQKTGRRVFCRECPDNDNCDHDGNYIFPGVSKLLAFWNNNEAPYQGNWMSQPIGFSKMMSICNQELSDYRRRKQEK